MWICRREKPNGHYFAQISDLTTARAPGHLCLDDLGTWRRYVQQRQHPHEQNHRLSWRTIQTMTTMTPHGPHRDDWPRSNNVRLRPLVNVLVKQQHLAHLRCLASVVSMLTTRHSGRPMRWKSYEAHQAAVWRCPSFHNPSRKQMSRLTSKRSRQRKLPSDARRRLSVLAWSGPMGGMMWTRRRAWRARQRAGGRGCADLCAVRLRKSQDS